MAQQHRTAVLVRRFLHSLSKTIVDGTVEVGGCSLDDWMAWAADQADAFDPLSHGVESVFSKLAKSWALVRA